MNTRENLDVDPEAAPQKKIKVPRRVVHCSDGVYEEYSTDEDELEERKREEEKQRKRALIDPKTLSWYSWMFHMSWLTGSSCLLVTEVL